MTTVLLWMMAVSTALPSDCEQAARVAADDIQTHLDLRLSVDERRFMDARLMDLCREAEPEPTGRVIYRAKTPRRSSVERPGPNPNVWVELPRPGARPTPRDDQAAETDQ